MLIRDAKDSDLPFLKRLLEQLGYPEHDDEAIKQKILIYQQDRYRLLVAEVDHEVVGFIALHWFYLFHLAGDLGRISAFCVAEGHRSRGIGIALLQEAEKLFKSQGCKKIEVASNSRRTGTHSFYQRRGYSDDSKRFVRVL